MDSTDCNQEYGTGKPDPEEQRLLEQACRGDRSAFGDIVRRYMKQAYFCAFAIVRSHEDAENLSQDAFARAYRKIDTFDTARPFFPWFHQVLRNLCFNHLEKRRRRGCEISIDADSDDGGIELPDTALDPRSEASDSEVHRRLWHEIGCLQPDHREILLLRDIEDYSYRDIAGILGIPIGTVMSRLYSARAALRERMVKYL